MFTNDNTHNLPSDNGTLNEDLNSIGDTLPDESGAESDEETTTDDETLEDRRPRLNNHFASAPQFRRYSSLW